jgi:glycerol kinase
MPATHVLALDQGTTSSRSIVFDAEGRIVAQVNEEVPQRYPRPGWVEHDPREIWASQTSPPSGSPTSGRRR